MTLIGGKCHGNGNLDFPILQNVKMNLFKNNVFQYIVFLNERGTMPPSASRSEHVTSRYLPYRMAEVPPTGESPQPAKEQISIHKLLMQCLRASSCSTAHRCSSRRRSKMYGALAGASVQPQPRAPRISPERSHSCTKRTGSSCPSSRGHVS